MLTKFKFELSLEQIAEKFYFNAASAMTSARGGNSRGNEVYFGNVSTDLRKQLDCQQIILPKGECPDSGVFGDFGYKSKEDVNWSMVKSGKLIIIEVNVPNNQKRYIEVEVSKLNLPTIIKPDSEINLRLNDFDLYGEFFGIEYKASKNSNQNSITVASFNSSCPSPTKTTELVKVGMIHCLPTTMRKKFENDECLKKCEIKLNLNFSMYYFIVNDEENGTRSEIKQIFLCSGSFFAPTITEEEAAKLSKQLMPEDLGLKLNLHKVKLRYRPFFESKAIRANGYGLYTSWEPKIPGDIKEQLQRETLLNEVERVQQNLEDQSTQPSSSKIKRDDDNVIYLNLREERIRRRSVA